MTLRHVLWLLPGALLAVLLPAAPAAADCPDDPGVLCLGERFAVEVRWEDFKGARGAGHPQPLSADTGYFWFFRDANVELVVKVLDGRPVNGHFWVFYGALSSVAYEITVTDTLRGTQRRYANPAGHFASRGDTTALPAAPGGAFAAAPLTRCRTTLCAPTVSGSAATAPGAPLHLADGRFRVEVTWQDPRVGSGSGAGTGVPLSDDSGYFWFFRDANVELIVKVLDGRPVTGDWWVFYGALSNVAYRLTVTDTLTGVRHTYVNPAGTFASRGDTAALPGRPLAGFGLSPRYFASIDRPWAGEPNLRAFFAELEGYDAGVWAVNGHWYELLANDGRLLPGLDEILADYPGVRVVGAVQFVELESGLPRLPPDSTQPDTWEAWQAAGGWDDLTEAAVRFAARQRPPFLSIGVEINRFARFFPVHFDHFAGRVYPEIVRRVAEVSPDTVVFPGFQFEWMIGDLTGSVGPDGRPGCATCVPPGQGNSLSGRSHPAMGDVLDRFPADVLTHVGFTTYPYFNRDAATPDDLPDDYYTRLYDQLDADHQGVRLLFVETGWPANAALSELEACELCTLVHPEAAVTCHPQVLPAAPCDAARLAELVAATDDWLGSEAEQEAWARRFLELTAPLSPALTLWGILHDADPRNPAALTGLFTHIGLRTHDGSRDRPAWQVWRQEWAP